MSSEFWGMTAFFISTLALLFIIGYLQRRIKQLQQKHIQNTTYKEAWAQLHNALGERMQNEEELELMDAVLQSVKLDFEEYKQCVKQSKNTDAVP